MPSEGWIDVSEKLEKFFVTIKSVGTSNTVQEVPMDQNFGH
jgi:hypothetical protein